MGVTILSAQSETVKPTFGVSFDRPVKMAIIEGQTYNNVIVEIDVADKDSKYNVGVLVVIKDSVTRKKIFKKRLPKSYLYAFSDGTITIGKGNALTQMELVKIEDKTWVLEFREKGLY